jgi:RNA polymerase sigma factor (sigma-70 family)
VQTAPQRPMSQLPPDENINELVERCRAGDQAAATALFHRYVDKLIALVRGKLSQKLNSRIDPEDILQSAYRSFFNGLDNARFKVEGADELWGLLAAIALHKLYRQVAYHTAKKRAVQREQPRLQDDGLLGAYPELIAELPTPAEAAELIGELDHVMNRLDALERAMLELRLEGYTIDEIALQVNRSPRTVRRLMEKVRGEFQRRLMAQSSA